MKSSMTTQGDVVSSQPEIGAVVSAYWKQVMRHRPTCPIAIAIAIAQVNASITNVLPNNDELDSPLHGIADDQENFMTHDQCHY